MTVPMIEFATIGTIGRWSSAVARDTLIAAMLRMEAAGQAMPMPTQPALQSLKSAKGAVDVL